MEAGRASRTAQHNTLFRALESALPAERRLVEDPLAEGFLSGSFSVAARLGHLPGLRAFFPWFIDRRWPGVRTALVSRTRLIDEAVLATLDGGTEQLVILGAGFDSRAYRLAGLADLDVFEVDHPDTQAAKRAAVARVLAGPPKHVRFVASDFSDGDLASVMDAAGYSAARRTLILWEGVMGYLTPEAVDATLQWCARASRGSRLVFTYLHRHILTRPETFVGSRQLFAALERAGERLRFGIDPDALSEFLSARGFQLESDVGATEYRRRYYGEAARRMHGHEFYRVAQARVIGT